MAFSDEPPPPAIRRPSPRAMKSSRMDRMTGVRKISRIQMRTPVDGVRRSNAMPLMPDLDNLSAEMTTWRRQLHQRPETAFEETWTSDYIAAQLASFGIPIHRGLAKTGIVGVIDGTTKGNRAIGLRADIDALHIEEANTFAHRSQHAGKMHACGHDGHSAMLLGAAKHLSEHRDFSGTVYVIFQPAEENEGGGRVMVDEGLFERFPMDAVYGMHNRPGLAV